MRPAHLCAVVAFFACGCGPKPPAKLYGEPYYPGEVQLPAGAGAAPLGKDDAIYLNVTEAGKVLLSPSEQYLDSEGVRINTFDKPEQVYILLNRHAKEHRDTGKPHEPSPLPAIVLRVDARTPFEKTSGVTRAARRAGYVKFHWRALRPGGDEGRIECIGPLDYRHHHEGEFVARVTAEANKIAKITLHGHGIAEPGLDVGTDSEAFLKRLKEIKAQAGKRDHPIELALEIDGTILQTDVIRLLDVAVQAGFKEVYPYLPEPKKR